MGVNSLWDIVGPAARPVKLEALSRKKLAVDASIWIYQFLKAVRDKDGNSLGQTHIVGFFRRICKLLYFGILPLFVFDGGAPPLKRQTIQKRKDRRQGNQDNATTTAQKLLAISIQRQAHEASRPKKRTKTPKKSSKSATPNPDEGVYLEDLPNLHPEHGTSALKSPEPVEVFSSPEKRFVKRDEYHLPDLKQFTVLKKDTRIMPASEFQEFADDASFDVVDGIEIDSVDPLSREFKELPLATQYMILSHLRLRSRLRLGYLKSQLEDLFPDSKDFSKFQIQQVQKRNFYTQRLMNVNGMDEDLGNSTRRIAGDKDRHYALIRTGDGWTLSLNNEDDTKPVVLDENGEVVELKEPLGEKVESEQDSDDELEDVPLGNNDEDNDNPNDNNDNDDNDDDEMNRATIASIYEQYKEDYEDANDFDAIELKEAIEQLKRDLMQLKHEEEKVQAKIKAADPAFDFCKSMLFLVDGNEKDEEIKKVEEIGKAKDAGKDRVEDAEQAEEVKLSDSDVELVDVTDEVSEVKSKDAKSGSESGSEPESAPTAATSEQPQSQSQLQSQSPPGSKSPEKIQWDEIDNEPEELPKEPSPQNEMPTWFADDLHNPHEANEFITEDKERPQTENEKAGLISWTEARDMMDSESDIEELPQQSSDIEEISAIPNIPKQLEEAATVSANSDPIKQLAPDASKPKPDVPQNKRATKVTSKRKTAAPASKRKKATVIDYDFEEQDEEQLVRQLRDEEEQHAEFAHQIRANQQLPSNVSVTEEQLLQERLQKAKRDSDEVSETMISDVQELLKRFGIPFITAPMEAEAQCAELFKLGLVDGIVTDDSDCFLFGGLRIYKNMFNQKQYVECYISEDIEHTIGLDRDKLIELALLLGSDYTEGVKGIGPVLAMEILAEFKNLKNFKKWFDEQTQRQTSPSERTPLEKNLLNRIKNGKLFLPSSFPDQIVKDAYTHADVDSDDSEFRWGVPLLDQIRTFLMYNVGWTQARVDEVMVPLIRDMNRKRAEGTQSTIGEFFPQEYISYKKEVNLGKRMKVAASKLKK